MKVNYILVSLLLGMLIGAVSASSIDPDTPLSLRDGLTKYLRADPTEAGYLVD
ncbi:hypothetical protein [Polynucleobacter sphagniphilus]|uniref:Uncharacterized protein n=1 Tax=Polynucleobacter sphagniphilus TaxID=1743169 RepID=A0AA43S5J4_9BURK|nr:hypothetical protein [Polynucleobacter sphagniphilus]MDF9788648.1 hypothetical protein [Polynucleobacter sphagniphilus]MDH6155227.1 hypothetical protein [Polynucleobacter sphagniphilus]MDH6241815.1 hypothetical protein [Polynucleobacter sphagniphilus]MDH6250181.1 hypothetical protein [Polynucleobacter sphagniphilus]MDH6299739.1 hypothetical protein [Polynucleobacter sphagniphilus]